MLKITFLQKHSVKIIHSGFTRKKFNCVELFQYDFFNFVSCFKRCIYPKNIPWVLTILKYLDFESEAIQEYRA